MPELPEVETVRRDLAAHVTGRTVAAVEVCHPRAVRRHVAGARDFAAAVAGHTIRDVHRRGKYLWLALDGGDAILCHLGMSGQFRVCAATEPDEPHLRVRFTFIDGDPQLRFIDQRTFGGMAFAPGGAELPAQVAHIARDPLDPRFSDDAFVAALARRHSAIKRLLLDQSLVSGIGNIYADEALWRARLHGDRPADSLRADQVRALLAAVREVLTGALADRGTSFDALYVDVNGRSGSYGDRLDVYGQADRPCSRCGTTIVRQRFMNRSSYFCPTCQPVPEPVPAPVAAGRIRRAGAARGR